MRDFSNGVSFYTKATAEIGFPEDDVCCHWCPFLSKDYQLDRTRCNKTGEILLAPKHTIGFYCPLTFENKEND